MKDIRLRQYFKDDVTFIHVVNLYRNLRGKENLEKRLLFKAMIWASINPGTRHEGYWRSPDDFFHPYRGSVGSGFNLSRVDRDMKLIQQDSTYPPQLYGHILKDKLGYLI
jgi:hypothetical protein